MIFEQVFDTKSSTYTYIVSSGKGREALIIDPVIEHTEEYIKVLGKLELKSSEREVTKDKTKVAVKVVDIFGNDTTKVLEVKL